MITLTDADFQELEEQGEMMRQPTELGDQVNLPRKFGNGRGQDIHLRNGLIIQIINFTLLLQPISLVQQHECLFPLTAKFCLSGSSRIQTLNATDIDDDYEEINGYSYLYHLPHYTEIERWPSASCCMS